MISSEWTESIKDIVRKIGDRAYQERSWFGEGPEVSSPDEMLCRVFDDLDFTAYLTAGDVHLTEVQKRCGDLLREALEAFSAHTPEYLDPVQVIDAPEWENVRKLGVKFARALDSERVSSTTPSVMRRK